MLGARRWLLLCQSHSVSISCYWSCTAAELPLRVGWDVVLSCCLNGLWVKFSAHQVVLLLSSSITSSLKHNGHMCLTSMQHSWSACSCMLLPTSVGNHSFA